MFLQPQLVIHIENIRHSTVSSTSDPTPRRKHSTINCFFSFSSFLTQKTTDTQLFLQPQLVLNTEDSRYSTVSSVSARSSHRRQQILNRFFILTSFLTQKTTDTQLFLQPQPFLNTEDSRYSTVSSASARS